MRDQEVVQWHTLGKNRFENLKLILQNKNEMATKYNDNWQTKNMQLNCYQQGKEHKKILKLFYFQTCSTTSSQALDTGTLRISLFDPPFTILHGLLYYNSLVCLLYPENWKTRGLTTVFQFKNTLVSCNTSNILRFQTPVKKENRCDGFVWKSKT